VGGRRAEACVIHITRNQSPYRASRTAVALLLSSPSPRERNRAAATPNPNGLGGHLLATCWSRGKLAHFSDRHDKGHSGEIDSSGSIPWPAEASPPAFSAREAAEESAGQTNAE
jgi:hypothetical protein